MNLRQPYEQLIADKLRQVRPPDADSSWQQMKRLLDDDEDKGGGAKRPPGNNGWWRIGIIAVVLSAGFWLYADKHPSPGNSLSKNNAAEQAQSGDKINNAGNSNAEKTKTISIGDNTTLTNSSKTDSKSATDSKQPVTTGAAANTENSNVTTGAVNNTSATAAATSPNDKNNVANTNGGQKALVVKKSNTGSVNNTTAEIPGTSKASAADEMTTTNKKTFVASSNKKKSDGNGQQTLAANSLSFEQKNGSRIKPSLLGNEAGIDQADRATNNNKHPFSLKHAKGQTSNTKAQSDNNDFASGNDLSFNTNTVSNNHYTPAKPGAASKEKAWCERLTELAAPAPAPDFNIAVTAGDSVARTRDVSNLLNSETKKSIAKAQREKEIALLDKKDKKSLHLNLSNLFKPFSMRPLEAEPWWAAGLAVNGGVTVGAQNRYNYNVNGKSGIISDYIPSPYLQYHINNYVYLQTELNFLTPQYTPQLLVYRQNGEVTATGGGTGGVSQQKSIYIQKLYYFNWPVSLHYSPVSNLFFSAGLQFSSFQSGLAAIEAKQYPTTLGPDHASGATTDVLKFKDDSIAAKIAPNEWRWQVGAEYYINRFSVGLRYNQALKNSINTSPSTALPPTVNRNQSLLFFVRYNLFESRNKASEQKN